MSPPDGAAEIRRLIAVAEEVRWPKPDMGVLRLHRRLPPTVSVQHLWPAVVRLDCDRCRGCRLPARLCRGAAACGRVGADRACPLGTGDVGLGRAAASMDRRCRRLRQRQEPRCRLFDARRAARDRAPHGRPLSGSVTRLACGGRVAAVAEESWKAEVRTAQKANKAPPLPPAALQTSEPEKPRLRQHDVTIERVATLLATTAPKGLLIIRDELAGWIEGMAQLQPGRSRVLD